MDPKDLVFEQVQAELRIDAPIMQLRQMNIKNEKFRLILSVHRKDINLTIAQPLIKT